MDWDSGTAVKTIRNNITIVSAAHDGSEYQVIMAKSRIVIAYYNFYAFK